MTQSVRLVSCTRVITNDVSRHEGLVMERVPETFVIDGTGNGHEVHDAYLVGDFVFRSLRRAVLVALRYPHITLMDTLTYRRDLLARPELSDADIRALDVVFDTTR